jgi:hypothetical protein
MRRQHRFLAAAVAVVILGVCPAVAEHRFNASCELAVYEERVELENTELEVELATSRLAAFEKIFVLIDKLWKAEALERLTYLRGKFDRDAARLDLERAGLQQQRQQALLDHYKVICGTADKRNSEESLDDIRARYRRADCDQQAKAVEVAEVDLEFSQEWLASVRDLRASDVATLQDLISAELDVTLEKQRLADAKKRVAVCRGDG